MIYKALSPLFVKVWRMAKLLSSITMNVNVNSDENQRRNRRRSPTLRRVQVSNSQACVYTLPLIVIESLILLLFSLVDPPHPKEILGVGDGIGVQQITCTHNTSSFFITQMIFHGTLLINFLKKIGI
jgi:hypothetical protein